MRKTCQIWLKHLVTPVSSNLQLKAKSPERFALAFNQGWCWAGLFIRVFIFFGRTSHWTAVSPYFASFLHVAATNRFVFHPQKTEQLNKTQTKRTYTNAVWEEKRVVATGGSAFIFHSLKRWGKWRQKKKKEAGPRWMAAPRCHTPAKRTERRSCHVASASACRHTHPGVRPAAGRGEEEKKNIPSCSTPPLVSPSWCVSFQLYLIPHLARLTYSTFFSGGFQHWDTAVYYSPGGGGGGETLYSMCRIGRKMVQRGRRD